MAKIHIIGGEKGGVGKSVVARLLAQYMIDKEIPFLGFDADRSHGALLRFYAGFASPVLLSDFESLDKIVESAIEQPERRILVDLAAQSQEPLVRWMDDSGVLELTQETGVSIQYWHVMDAGRDSVDLLKKILDKFGGKISFVLVLNQIRGDDFSMLKNSGELDRAAGMGATVITIRHLHDAVMNKIDASNSSFWAAKNTAEKVNTGLGLMERQRVKTWLRGVYEELDKAGI